MNASNPTSFARLEKLAYQRLHRRFELGLESRHVAGAIRRIYCIHDPDAAVARALASQQSQDNDSRVFQSQSLDLEKEPYWMQHWPSAEHLEAELDRLLLEFKPGDPKKLRVLEFGCGGGLLSLGLALRKIQVLATDYSTDALLLTKLNGYANHVIIETRRVDWRSCLLEPHDLVVGADVAYDRAVFADLNECLVQSVATEGIAIFAEPHRSMGDDFIAFLLRKGWFVQIRKPRFSGESKGAKRCRFIVVRHRNCA